MIRIGKLKCVKTQVEAKAGKIGEHRFFIYCPACDIGGVFDIGDPMFGHQLRTLLVEKFSQLPTLYIPPTQSVPEGFNPSSKTFHPSHHFIID